MDRHDFDIPITFKHRVIFTRDAFAADNSALANVLIEGGGRRVLVFIENTVAAVWKTLPDHIHAYFEKLDFDFRGVRIFAGGEACKADETLVREVWREIDTSHIDRHSYVISIGGGAFLDAVGYAVATAHRGLRLVRFPTTTLSQDDSGVGVKNAINAFGKKNWIGTFSVPFAVINDFKFLGSQDPESSVSGLIEAIKVALVKDGEFFKWIEANVTALSQLDREPFEECIKRSALLHARHIALGGDPFETGSSRPLDFGHWAAHKMEALTNYELSHAEAVAVGLALDTIYSQKIGFLNKENAERIIKVLINLGLKTYHPALDWADSNGNRRVLAGLDEFREHLGGELTVLLLSDLGKGVDVHEFNTSILEQSIEQLREMWELAAH
jgi:3-dehydroquinate synthase